LPTMLSYRVRNAFASLKGTIKREFNIDQHVGTAMHTRNISSSQSVDPTTPN